MITWIDQSVYLPIGTFQVIYIAAQIAQVLEEGRDMIEWCLQFLLDKFVIAWIDAKGGWVSELVEI